MYDRFRWTNLSARRNALTLEYEPLQPFFILALAEKAGCGLFLDVGANIGAYALFATLIPTVERVVAFEANPETIDELKANIALNGLAIEVQGKAVSSAPGTVSFGVVSKFSGANSVVDTSIHGQTAFHKEVTVEAITLDQMFPEPIGRPVALKIDVEGHEAQVLEGARAMLAANRAVIQMEGYDDSASERILRELGYFRLTRIGPDHYFSNIETLRDPAEVVGVYERAAEEMIAYNHRNKAVTIRRGDVGLQLTGKSGDFARDLAKRLIGKHL